MTRTVADLKAATDFGQLVAETHAIDRTGKVLCPAHDDKTPSCHIYDESAYCFSCGWHADAVTWLETVHNLTTAEAIAELKRRAGGLTPLPRRQPQQRQQPRAESCKARPVPADVLAGYLRRTPIDRLPAALAGRGIELEDARSLRMARAGEDVLFLVTAPDGVVVAIKRRRAHPGDGSRYVYESPGHGTPAWCSPGFMKADKVLVIEGELNGMACYLAMPELAVMGVAGTGGGLHLEALRGRTVYCYADDDQAGQQARDKWARAALEAGARAVFTLEPWDSDACEIAGEAGREALRELLVQSIEAAQSLPQSHRLPQSGTALNLPRLGQGKWHLPKYRRDSKGRPCL